MEENGKAGKYELRSVIGRGAAGVVFEGWDPVLTRKVAIKALVLDVHDAEAREQYVRFQQEAQAAARLQHPNIVAVFDYGETPTHAYIVMEYLQGGSLKARMEGKSRFAIDEALSLMRGILAGLHHSHEHGVVHRDVKPANLVFDDEGQVKITDFGIARLESSKLTMTGALLGTPAYMSPEQVLGEIADQRSDIYSAGVILYEMLTGRRPFEGTASSIMHKIVHAPPPPPSGLPPHIPPHFDAVLAKALAKLPEDRYRSAAEFSAALQADDQTLSLVRPSATAATQGTAPASASQANSVASPRVPATAMVAVPAQDPVMLTPIGGKRPSAMMLGAAGVVAAGLVAVVLWLVLGGTPPKMAAVEPAKPVVAAVVAPATPPVAVPATPPVAAAAPPTIIAPVAPPVVAPVVVPVPVPPSRPAATAPPAASAVPAAPAPLAANEFRSCAHCPVMVGLPAGQFAMGSNDDPTQQSIHNVGVPAFAIGKFPLSVAEWQQCTTAGACPTIPASGEGDPARMPMGGLSWTDAAAYAAWLAKTSGRPYRLATEAEWEYAARAGTTTRYWWGDEAGTGHADCAACGGVHVEAMPQPIDAFAANPWGLYGVAGGVAEWVDDCWHLSYLSQGGAPRDGSAWQTDSCARHVLRGGSWKSVPGQVTVSARLPGATDLRDAANGTRIALSLP